MNTKNNNSSDLFEETIEGSIEGITYQNSDNGYTVARFKKSDDHSTVTIVGKLLDIRPGEQLKLKGQWIKHKKFGRQFEIGAYDVQLPATKEGIKNFLGSGLIKGIGPVTAAKIVDRFGDKTLEIIENDPDELISVSGISKNKVKVIKEAWREHQNIKDIMIFLQGHGISMNQAVKIFQTYGEKSIEMVKKNPYQLSKDIFGIGFKTADDIAQKIGINPEDKFRIQAGIIYCMLTQADNGHCFMARGELIDETGKMLNIGEDLCREQVDWLISCKELIQEDDLIFLPYYYLAEVDVTDCFSRILQSEQDSLSTLKNTDWGIELKRYEAIFDINLTEQQKDAIVMALTEKICVITGGPGTGKSTITKIIVALLLAKNKKFSLAAPTGRASKRLSEATGEEAKTIHRLLEFTPLDGGGFNRNANNPLEADMVIIDETSMIDILLMKQLVSAIKPESHLLLIGDVDQLPSVGAGNVLKDIISCDKIPTIRLDTIFRQSQDSYIIVNAHNINHGKMPLFSEESKDFFIFKVNEPAKVAEWVLDVVKNRIPRKFGHDPYTDIQVLSPMYRGDAGVTNLNAKLQNLLNPPNQGKNELPQRSRVFREGDRIMQIRNDYDKLVFNGDIGSIRGIDFDNQHVKIDYEGREVIYEFSQLDELVHAYAVTIHKSQGSEFPVVVLPLITAHYLLLQRNLIYTAVTRARELVVIVGSKKALAMAVKNDRINLRNTTLAKRLQGIIIN